MSLKNIENSGCGSRIAGNDSGISDRGHGDSLDRDNVKPGPFRSCTRCGQAKPISDYYFKGLRVDSICKECKKTSRRAAYQSKEGETIIRGIGEILNYLSQQQHQDLREFNHRFKEHLNQCEATSPNQSPK